MQKTLREYCGKNPKKKSRDSLTIYVVGKLSNFMMGKIIPVKYGDPGNPILTMQINGIEIPNMLVNLGIAINVITVETMQALGPENLKPTPTGLELADRSMVKPVGKLQDITILVDLWHYLVDFVVLQTHSTAGGIPLF